ncbi:MAG: hypothetical protein R3F62_23775 [Planctomycetota bacterium]
MRRALPTVLILLAGCASSEPAHLGRGLRLDPGWWASPSAASVERLGREAEALAEAPSCLGARLREVPDVAHALWLGQTEPQRQRISAAFAAAGLDAYTLSDACSQRHPEDAAQGRLALGEALTLRVQDPERARALAEQALSHFQASGDPLLAAEARLLGAELALTAGEPLPELGALPTPAQTVQAALLTLGAADAAARPEPAIALAREVGHGAALERLASAIQRGALLAPLELDAFHRARSALAARAGEGERALLAAELALRAAEAQGSTARMAEARLSLAQARLLLGQPAAAALEASAVAEAGTSVELGTQAEGLLGQALFQRGQPEAAAEAYAAPPAPPRPRTCPTPRAGRCSTAPRRSSPRSRTWTRSTSACARCAGRPSRPSCGAGSCARSWGSCAAELTGPPPPSRSTPSSPAPGRRAYGVVQRYGDLPRRIASRASTAGR